MRRRTARYHSYALSFFWILWLVLLTEKPEYFKLTMIDYSSLNSVVLSNAVSKTLPSSLQVVEPRQRGL